MSGPTARAAQIAHVLFLDIVGYSRASTSAQGRMLEQLNAAVSASPAFTAAKAAGGVQPIPTGDGMVLLFASDVIAPAQCAVEVCRALEGGQGSHAAAAAGTREAGETRRVVRRGTTGPRGGTLPVRMGI